MTRALLSCLALAALLLSGARAEAQNPWSTQLEDLRQTPYTPFRARAAQQPRVLGAGPPAEPGLPQLPAGPPGAAGQDPAALAELLGAVPRIDWLPGLPAPPGAFDNGFVPPEPQIPAGNVPKCLEGFADAVSYQLAGYYQAGVLVSRAVLRACPQLEEAAVVLGMLELRAHKTRDAVATLQATYERGRRPADALTLMGLWCLFLGDNLGATENLREALQKDEAAWRARLALATQQARQDKPDQARRSLEPLARRPDALRSPPDLDLLDLDRWAGELLLAATRRDAPRCTVCLRTVADIAAAGAGRRGGYAALLLWQEAVGLLQEVVAVSPEDVDNRIALGRALGYATSYRSMAEVYRAGLERGDQRFVLLLGRALLDQERPAEALPLLQRATQLEPERAEAWSLLGTAQRILGLPEALDSLRRALSLDPERLADRADLGQVLLARNYYPEAIDEFRRALERNPLLRKPRYGLGQALAALGRAEEARVEMERYREVLDTFQQQLERQEERSNLEASTVMGLEHLSGGRLDLARASFAAPLQAKEPPPLAWLGQAALLLHAGKRDAARAPLDRVLQLSGTINSFIQTRAEAEAAERARREADAAAREAGPGAEVAP